jgi:hypothetical protein
MSDLAREENVTLITIWWWQKLGQTGSKQMSNTKIYVETESQEINNIESREQYQAKISNRFTAVENLFDDVDINGTWETIRKNIAFSQRECRLL